MKHFASMRMAKQPSSFKHRNKTTKSFRALYSQLPMNVQELARLAAREFHDNQNRPGFRLHRLYDTKNSSHKNGSFSVTIGGGYRAIYVEVDRVRFWYWIGSHATYNTFTGC